MDYVVEWQDYETTFNNEKVTMKIHPLNIEALLKIAPHLKDAAVLDGSDNMALMVNSLEIHKLSDAILREHVRDVLVEENIVPSLQRLRRHGFRVT